MELLTEKATLTYSSKGFTSMTTPIVPLHMPWVIRELLRYMTRAPGCRRTHSGRFVFGLNIWFESEGAHCSEFTKSIACEIKNLFSETGRELQIILLINWAFSLKPTIWVVLSSISSGAWVKNSKCRCRSLFHVSVERLPNRTSSSIW